MGVNLKQNQMMFQKKLEALLESRNVYFQPPASFKLSYPCIVYSVNRVDRRFANNNGYIDSIGYSVTYISRSSDDSKAMALLSLPNAFFDRFYVADNLSHYSYTIYNQKEETKDAQTRMG